MATYYIAIIHSLKKKKKATKTRAKSFQSPQFSNTPMAMIKDLQRRACVRLTTQKPHRLSLTPLALQPPASLPAGRYALEEAAPCLQATAGTFSSWTLPFIVSYLLSSSLCYSITVPPWRLLPRLPACSLPAHLSTCNCNRDKEQQNVPASRLSCPAAPAGARRAAFEEQLPLLQGHKPPRRTCRATHRQQLLAATEKEPRLFIV